MHDRRSFFHRCAGLAAGTAIATAPVALAQTTYLDGIDVSHWQGTGINWPNVKAAGTSFAFCKATEGLSYFDDTFNINWAGMKANNIYRGAYHFGRPLYDPIAQARFFYEMVKPTSGDLPMVLDLEEDDGKTATQIRYWAQRFVQELKRKLGQPPIIYTGLNFWNNVAGNSPYNYDCPLWVANWKPNYTAYTPAIPSAWSGWKIWQWSSTGNVAGINPVDRDVIIGNTATLQSMQLP